MLNFSKKLIRFPLKKSAHFEVRGKLSPIFHFVKPFQQKNHRILFDDFL